jgi:hypothetical protein
VLPVTIFSGRRNEVKTLRQALARPGERGTISSVEKMSQSSWLEFCWAGAGDAVTGRAAGAGRRVELLRLERSSRGTCARVVAEAPVGEDGRFALTVPDHVLPTATGVRCELRYVVRADEAAEDRYPEVVVVATASPHVDEGSWHADHLLACWTARHFHVELTGAELEGGGRLAGRVYRHRTWPPGAIAVRARCLECWRCSALGELGHAEWRSATLWQADQRLQPEPEAAWAPFSFALPAHLPPAVEALTIAWRYEVVARRAVRHWFDETAAVTPLLHEVGLEL